MSSLEQNTPEILALENDSVARFMYSESNYGNERVKHSLFIPPKEYPSELSVFKINNPVLNEPAIWELADNFGRPDKPVLGRAELSVSHISTINDQQGGWLKVWFDGNPHPRHGNIKTLPLDRSLRKAIAVELTEIAGKPILREG